MSSDTDPEPSADAAAARSAGAPAASPTPAASATLPALHRVSWGAPWRWLRLGWRDFTRAPAIGLFYGACFALMGWALLWVFRSSPAYVLALSGGFLLVGPFLCLGLYRVSQRLEAGERPGFADSLFAWQERMGPLAIFGVVLLVLEMLWGRATLVVFAVMFDDVPDFRGSLLTLLAPENLPFVAVWAALGAVFATLIYAVGVVSMPMMLHRQTDAISAGLTSLRLVLTQTGPMLLWAALIAALVFAAMLPGFAGLLVVAPVLGHASWHAYRAAVAD